MLALVGSGEYLPPIDPLDRNLIDRLAEPPRVVCLPTAAGTEGDRMIASWMARGVSHFTQLGADVQALKVWDNATANDPAHAEAVRAANFVYLSGGKPAYLYQSLRGSLVWDAIMAVHAQGGLVAGCSAGAMIMGERIGGPGGNSDGFGLLPGVVIIPHFDEFPGIVSRVLRMFAGKNLTVLGVDGNTALVVNDGHFEAVGSGGVTVMRGKQRERFEREAISAEFITPPSKT